jgi:hypothetical protein
MASKDFIYDLLDKLEEDKTEYLLFTFQRGEGEGQGDVHYNFYNKESREEASRVLRALSRAVLNIENERDILEIDLEDEDEEEDDKE